MPSSEEKKKRKMEKAEKLRTKQEEALKKAHEQEQKADKESASAKQKEDIPEEMSAKGYKISSNELSSGQFSTVFNAKHNDEDIVARVVEKQGKEDSFVNKLIPRFVRILRALDERHPNIISILDVFETSKRVLILMRPIKNGSLYDFIDKQSDPTDESQCRKWAQQLVSALCYLHINGIVHRDLRTERILLDENKCLKISGFTYSRLWLNVKKNTKEFSNTCVGTGPYCAPETLSGESYDPRTADVWAFGVIVFFIWNKSYPFDYNMTHKLLAQHKSNEWINRIRSESSDLIKELFRKTFDVNHSQRQSIVDLLKDKWIDSKITAVLDENLRALDGNSVSKDTPEKNNQSSKANDQVKKGTDMSPKGTEESSNAKNELSKGVDETSKAKEETPKGEESTKCEKKSDKSNSNAIEKANTEKNTNKGNESKEDTEDSEDATDITDDDDEDDSEKNEVNSDQTSKGQQKKPKASKGKNEEKPPKMKISTTAAKREMSDNKVLRPDILEELKKNFLSLK